MIVRVLEPYSLIALARLKADGVTVLEGADNLSDAEVVLIRSKTVVDEFFLDQTPKLKLVVTATSGFDHIDWRLCEKRGITVAQTPNANAQSTAELTLALMLASERQILAAHKNVKNNQWRDGLPRPDGLEDKVLGIIGLGRVGQKVARMARTLGMHVQAHDPYVADDVFPRCNAERLGLTEVLRSSDIVTLHVPLTKETKHLMNNPTFEEMAGAFLINTCRGPVVDENDLLKALDAETIRGAAMDVIEREPPPRGHRLLTHPRLLMTPHIGAFTTRAWEKASLEAVEKVLQFKRGARLEDTLPLATPWFHLS